MEAGTVEPAEVEAIPTEAIPANPQVMSAEVRRTTEEGVVPIIAETNEAFEDHQTLTRAIEYVKPEDIRAMNPCYWMLLNLISIV